MPLGKRTKVRKGWGRDIYFHYKPLSIIYFRTMCIYYSFFLNLFKFYLTILATHICLFCPLISLPNCCRKVDPFQGLRVGSCLTLGNELSEETHVLTKQETLLGRGTRVESRRVREPKRTSMTHGSQSWDLW